MKELGYRHPNFKNIATTPYDEEKGDLDVSCTYDTMDWVIADSSGKSGIKTLQDLLNKIEKNISERGNVLNYKYSNEIIMMHDDYRIKEMFQPLIRRIIEKEIKCELPKL